MARSRNIKPGFFLNDKLVELPFETRLLFVGLWTLADREGRLEDRPKRIKMALFPADMVDVDSCLNQLAETRFIIRYEVGGERFIHIREFVKHQRPHHKEVASVIPAPPSENNGLRKDESSTGQARVKHESSESPDGSLIPSSLIPPSKDLPPVGGERKRDELFDTIAEVCQTDIAQLTKSARGALNNATKQLRDVGATPEQVRLRAEMYRAKFPDCALSASALAKWWPTISPAAEDRWKRALRIQREKGLPEYRAIDSKHRMESAEQFMARVGA